MGIHSYLVIAMALATFKLWQQGTTHYSRLPHIVQLGFFGKKHAREMSKVAARQFSTWALPIALTAASLLVIPWWSWEHVDPTHELRWIVLFVSGIVTWRGATMDIDLATGKKHFPHRVLMIACWLGVWLYPGFLILLIHVGVTWLSCWYHHQHMPIRVLLMFLACLTGSTLVSWLGIRPESDEPLLAAFLFLTLCVIASHYFSPGMRKVGLGSHWYSWALEDRLTNLTVGAYLWGWLRFLPKEVVLRVVRLLRPYEVVFQIATLALELGAILMLFEPRLAIAMLIMLAGFQLLVFALGGIFFWQYIATNLVVAAVVASLTPALSAEVFGPLEGLVAVGIVVVFPHRQRIWRPLRLGWWCSPFYARTSWEVRGSSGTWYGLNNDFMCPHERIFGQWYGQFLVHDLRMTDHIGETQQTDVFQALIAATDIAEIRDAKERFGHDPYDAKRSDEHDRYFRSFIENFNAGKQKRVFPWWLKAPGGQMFYWSRLPRFKGQETIDRLIVRYQEDAFLSDDITSIEDRVIQTIDYSPESP